MIDLDELARAASQLEPLPVSTTRLAALVCAGTPELGQVVEIVQIFEGKILAVGIDAVTVALEGHPDKLDDFEDLLRSYGIVELQRTGRVALAKLDREARSRALKGKAG